MMTEQPQKQFKEEDEFFEGERDERTKQQSSQELLWLTKRRDWLRSLTQKERDYISMYGLESWEKRTGRKRDV
jgi:hypothetical protein